jgi:hypothetical protein
MGRNRAVGVGTERLYIADVYRRALKNLQDPIIQKALSPEKRATAKDIALAVASVKEAESEAEFITVKAQLNAGERQRLFSGMAKEAIAGGKITLDLEKVGLPRIVEYLVGWSFMQDGQPLPLNSGQEEADRQDRTSQILAVDEETFEELRLAIDWHIEQIEEARAARKNLKAGTPALEAISA